MSDIQIFVSWSMPASRVTAERAHEFLRKLFPTFKFFISSENISSGQRWFDVVSDKLSKCTIGIIVVTRENITRPWIHYEAGALAKLVEKSRVMPLLCGLGPSAIAETPLSAFQASELSKAGIKRIADSIREHTDYAQSETDFVEHFEMLWARLGADLCAVAPGADDVSSKPISAKPKSPSQADLSAQISQLTEIVRSMEARLPSKVASEDDLAKMSSSLLSGASLSDFSHMSSAEIIKALAVDSGSYARPQGRGLFGGRRPATDEPAVGDPGGDA